MSHVSTNVKPGESINDMMMNAPMPISEVANKFRRPVARNERPLEKAVHTRNNALVDRWYKEVLVPLADPSGNIQVLRVNKCFEYFFEGLETTQMQKFKDHMPQYRDEDVLFWINFFVTSEIEVIHEAGIAAVSAGWQVIIGALRNHFAQRRWDKIYSTTTVPIEWDKLANDNPHLMHSRPFPFDLTEDKMKDMEEKVRVVLGNPIQPK